MMYAVQPLGGGHILLLLLELFVLSISNFLLTLFISNPYFLFYFLKKNPPFMPP